jgi:hypothetical protein
MVIPRFVHPACGIFGGAIAWYLAHDIGFYYSHTNCDHRWILPTVHVLAFIVSVSCAWISFHSLPKDKSLGLESRQGFFAIVGTAAGSLFSLVILFQGIAAFIYSGCEI